MPTLSEYEKLALDQMQRGVIEEIITHNELMALLNFKGVEGNAFLYNRENTLGASATHQVGDTWSDTEPTFTQKTASLTIVGVQHPLDLFIAATRGNVNDQKAVLIQQMAKSLSRKIENLVVKGEPENLSTEPEGLDSICRLETRMRAMDDGNLDGPGTAETTLTLPALDEIIDDLEGGTPDFLMMNKKIRRKVTALSRASGSGVVMDQISMFGHQIVTYNGIPIVVNDFITNAEQYNDSSTWPSSTASTIFAVQVGEEKQGWTILHNGPVLNPEVQDVGIKEDANERLFRMAIYLQSITFSTKKIIALGGIDSNT